LLQALLSESVQWPPPPNEWPEPQSHLDVEEAFEEETVEIVVEEDIVEEEIVEEEIVEDTSF
jgi:hypothetical protein